MNWNRIEGSWKQSGEEEAARPVRKLGTLSVAAFAEGIAQDIVHEAFEIRIVPHQPAPGGFAAGRDCDAKTGNERGSIARHDPDEATVGSGRTLPE